LLCLKQLILFTPGHRAEHLLRKLWLFLSVNFEVFVPKLESAITLERFLKLKPQIAAIAFKISFLKLPGIVKIYIFVVCVVLTVWLQPTPNDTTFRFALAWHFN
jgi:hypothetical protein